MQSLNDDNKERKDSAGVIESIIVQPRAIRRHLAAPMLKARENYLAHLIARGFSRKVLCERAIRICDVIELMASEQTKSITDSDIEEATKVWIDAKHVSPNQAKLFKAAARCWFRFFGTYSPPQFPRSHFEAEFEEFSDALRNKYGFTSSTVAGCSGCVRRFLVWVSARTDDLSKVSQGDIDVYLAELRSANFTHRTVSTYCKDLRAFFRFAERQGWSGQYLSLSIAAPNSRTRLKVLDCPPWKIVRTLISSFDSTDPSECRGKAILLLASLYGMRTCEIVRLTLDDLDWYNEVITIRRAKRGRVQQFPLACEVGEALIRYLKQVRPSSQFRNVFLTIHRPHRPVLQSSPDDGKATAKEADHDGLAGRAPYISTCLRHRAAQEGNFP